MTHTTFSLEGRACELYAAPGARRLLVQPVDEHDLDSLPSEIAAIEAASDMPFALAAFRVADWNAELSPWEAPPVFGRQAFGSGARATLDWTLNRLLPEATARAGLSADAPAIVGGYSLAALFALWAGTATDRFVGVASASPSVWFPGWIDYARDHAARVGHVYLSLGDREARAKNPVLARVGDAVRAQHALLKDAGIDCALEWNAGNHFVDADARTAKAFAWCLNRIEGGEDRHGQG